MIGVLCLAAVAVVLAAIPVLIQAALLCVVAVQLCMQWQRIAQRQQPDQGCGVGYSTQGWQLWSPEHGWRAVQLRGDSMAVPGLILLRYRYAHQYFYRSTLIAADSLAQDSHRRLRLRLKFSRQRWQGVK